MNAIKRLIVENFQSHSKTIIEFADPGQLTTLIGSSDSGKTSLIRALYWVMHNEPAGTDFIRVGATFARVTIEFDSGDKVVRWRSSGGINRYIVNGETLEGFGTEVPEEVKSVTGVRAVGIGDISFNLNFGLQLEPPFLGKSVSAGTRAKVLGKLAGTEEVDFAGKQLGTDLYRRNQDEKRLAGEQKALEAQIAEYDYLPMMGEKIAELEKVVAAVKGLQGRRDVLTAKKDALKAAAERIDTAKAVLNRWECLDFVELLAAKIGEVAGRKSGLEDARKRLELAQAGIELSHLYLNRWRNLGSVQTFTDMAAAKIEKRMLMEAKQLGLVVAGDRIKEAQEVISRQSGIVEAENAIKKVAASIERRISVFRFAESYQIVNRGIVSAEKVLCRLPGLNEAEFLLAMIKDSSERRGKIMDLGKRLVSAESEQKQARNAGVLWEQRVAELEGAYKDELASIGYCPTCGGKITEKILKEAI